MACSREREREERGGGQEGTFKAAGTDLIQHHVNYSSTKTDLDQCSERTTSRGKDIRLD